MIGGFSSGGPRYGSIARLSFLPLIDILFATIGIFVVVLSILKITAVNGETPPVADVVLLVRADESIVWYDRFDVGSETLEVDMLSRRIDAVQPLVGSMPRILMAFHADAIGFSREVEGVLLRRLAFPVSAGGDDVGALDAPPARRQFGVDWLTWPLGAEDPDGAALVAQWRLDLDQADGR